MVLRIRFPTAEKYHHKFLMSWSLFFNQTFGTIRIDFIQRLCDTFKFFSKHMKGDESLWAASIRLYYSTWHYMTDEIWQEIIMSNINQIFFL